VTGYHPEREPDKEMAFATLVGSLKSTAALLGAAKTIDVSPHDLSHLLDLIAEKAVSVAEMSGFRQL
jgi:hypothetical protein